MADACSPITGEAKLRGFRDCSPASLPYLESLGPMKQLTSKNKMDDSWGRVAEVVLWLLLYTLMKTCESHLCCLASVHSCGVQEHTC